MANTLAPYRQSYIVAEVQRWWDLQLKPIVHMARESAQSAECDARDDLFVSYIERAMRNDDFEAIIGIDDFTRCLYKLGIVRVSRKPIEYRQLPSWRPSDNMTMRDGAKV